MRKLTHLCIAIALVVLLSAVLVQAQDFRSLWVGRLVMGQDKQGAAWMSDWVSNGQWPARLLYNWQPWPDYANDIGYHGVDVDEGSHHSGHGKDVVGQTSWWAGATNWTSPPAGQWNAGIEALYTPGTFDIYLSDNGPVTTNSFIDTPDPAFVPVKHTRRVDQPVVVVDGSTQQSVVFDPSGNSYTVDPDLKTDGMLEAQWTHPLGLTFHDYWYAWTHPDYDRLVIVETTITNSGDCDASVAVSYTHLTLPTN